MILLNKPLGLTPLQAIECFKEQNPAYKDKKISYAGRLDPLAEGLLILLVDEENKQRHELENLTKTYEFSVIFGISTDSYDTLGVITKQQAPPVALESSVKQLIPTLIGTQAQSFPPYSAKPVNGKPLYHWAREGKLDEIPIPEKQITITSLSLLNFQTLSPAQLQKAVLARINLVRGEFRQAEIRSSWQSFFNSTPLPHFPIFSFRITCSSGTYVRSIAQNSGEKLNLPALAFTISRTNVGAYSLKDALCLEPAEKGEDEAEDDRDDDEAR